LQKKDAERCRQQDGYTYDRRNQKSRRPGFLQQKKNTKENADQFCREGIKEETCEGGAPFPSRGFTSRTGSTFRGKGKIRSSHGGQAASSLR